MRAGAPSAVLSYRDAPRLPGGTHLRLSTYGQAERCAKLRFNPDDTEKVFTHTTTSDLVRAYTISETCARFGAAPAGFSAIQRAAAVFELTEKAAMPITKRTVMSVLGPPVKRLFRKVVFPHFCAGEHLEDCQAVRDRWGRYGVGVIVDHSKEEDERPEAHAHNLAAKIELLRAIRDRLGPAALFVPVKMTALASPALLERVTEAIACCPGWQTTHVKLSLDAADATAVSRAMDSLSRLCEEAGRVGVRLLLDAEQTHRQPAIDLLAAGLMARFNGGSKAVVYNTYQFYLQDTHSRLVRDMAQMPSGATFAAKIVRGAYMVSERRREGPVVSPLQDSKGATDHAYDTAVELVLRQLQSSPQAVAAVIATHNRASLQKAADLVDTLRLPRNHPNIHLAQILGMCDNTTAALGLAGFNAQKLVLFGHFHDLMPWLVRRLDENGDLLGAMAMERTLLRHEIRRRMGK